MGFVVGDVYHASQKECADHVRALLRGIGVTERMGRCPVSAPHVRYFYELCQRHPRAEEKMRSFVDFSVRRDLVNTSAMALYIVNADGSTTEISWRKCIAQKAETTHSKFLAALRNSVKDQVLEFRSAQASSECPMCGLPLRSASPAAGPHSPGASFHVDHVVHFAKLVDDFMEEHRGVFEVPVRYDKEPRTLLTIFTESDAEIAVLFGQYHRRYAQLRALCVSCNLTRPKHKEGAPDASVLEPRRLLGGMLDENVRQSALCRV
jgi:hypothetical protein